MERIKQSKGLFKHRCLSRFFKTFTGGLVFVSASQGAHTPWSVTATPNHDIRGTKDLSRKEGRWTRF